MSTILQILPEEWAKRYSENAHRAVFGKIKPASFDRIDYALLYVVDEKPAGYVTVRELDPDTVYWQFGGLFPWAQKSIRTISMIDETMAFQSKIAKRLVTYVENNNFSMLKFYLSRNLLITGIRHYNGSTLVELMKEWSDGNNPNIRQHEHQQTDVEKAT
jgi:hypothetical protein